MIWLFVAATAAAMADTLTLDNGAEIIGDLAVYQYDGNCQISVTEGDLVGGIVIIPCNRIARFERVPPPAQEELALIAVPLPAPLPVEAPVEELLEEEVVPLAAVVAIPVDAPIEIAAAESEPVEAAPVEIVEAAPVEAEAPIAPALVDTAGAAHSPPPVAVASLPADFTPPGAAFEPMQTSGPEEMVVPEEAPEVVEPAEAEPAEAPPQASNRSTGTIAMPNFTFLRSLKEEIQSSIANATRSDESAEEEEDDREEGDNLQM